MDSYLFGIAENTTAKNKVLIDYQCLKAYLKEEMPLKDGIPS